MFTFVILLLGISSGVLAGTCKTYKPVDDFSIKKFSGYWYLGGIEIVNSKDSDDYGDMRCTIYNFFVDNEKTTSHNWTVNLITRGKPTVLYGQYTLPDTTKGNLKLYFAPRNVTYNFFILCTDYVTYSVNYGCVQITQEENSAFLTIYVRDRKKYVEIVTKPEIKNCFKQLSSKNIEESLLKVPFENCPNIN